MNDKKQQIREAAEADLEAFIRLVHPGRVIGGVHQELIQWWERDGHASHQLVLLPRDHGKSAYAAYRAAWRLTKNPALRILYISSTANLAQKQLKFIKDILLSSKYRQYWPEMVNEMESDREKWTEKEIAVDHPIRKEEAIRDPSIFTAGLTTGITGMHCDIAILDDVVVFENAYTEEGRGKVKSQYSLLSSIEAADAEEWIVGTRYDPNDLYNDLQKMEVEIYNDQGEIKEQYSLYETMERQVEDNGDGSGQFLWPRQQRYDGKWFGFDQSILAKKKAQYLNQMQFRAQYYNDPNDPSAGGIQRDQFQYYDPSFISRNMGNWYFKMKRLNVFASIDFAYTDNHKSDFSSIVVVGVDTDHNYYILDIDRFKTDLISEYFSHVLKMHQKWDFRKLIAEITSGQNVIVKDLKNNYIRPHGLALSIIDHKPVRHMGRKEERIKNVLQHRYANGQMWHYRAGNCQILEDELVLQRPPHDDVKDALASCVEHAVPPSRMAMNNVTKINKYAKTNRFGGRV